MAQIVLLGCAQVAVHSGLSAPVAVALTNSDDLWPRSPEVDNGSGLQQRHEDPRLACSGSTGTRVQQRSPQTQQRVARQEALCVW